MRCRVRLRVLFVVLLMTAGCLGSVSSGNSPTATPGESSQLTPKPLPDQPDNLTHENAVQFTKEYEQSYTWNRELSDEAINMSVNPVRAEVLNRTDAGYIVHLEVSTTKKSRLDGEIAVGDGFYTVNYFINATTIQRAQTGGQQRPGPDPRDGETLEN